MHKFLIAEYSDEYGTIIDTKVQSFPDWALAEQYCRDAHRAMTKLFVKGVYVNEQLVTDQQQFNSSK